MRKLSVLYVAYPLLTVSEESAGGAEQMLFTLEREMAARGHRTTVAASEGSRVAGELLATGKAVDGLDQYEEREREHCERIIAYLQSHRGEFDLIHDESGSFWKRAGEFEAPVLATLHLPRSFYGEELFRSVASNVYFNCVSHSQASWFDDLHNFLGVVQNGIGVESFPFCAEKDDYLLWLGRICEEKGTHLAIAAARQAGMPLVIAGQVYPFSYHRDYFEREVRPALGSTVRFVERPSVAEKVDLLRGARALLVSSTAAETSSLVAMEAMACGTPVVGFRKGAIPEVVADGKTGFVVEGVEEMSAAISRVGDIDAGACRARVERFFAAPSMAADYEKLYSLVLARVAARSAA